MITDGNDEEASVDCQIERYLRCHPNAADTLEGVASWWLQDVPLQQIEAALQRLVEAGVVVKKTVPGGRFLYAKGSDRPGSDTGPETPREH